MDTPPTPEEEVRRRRSSRKIPPNLEQEVLDRMAGGSTSHDVVAWLKAEHGISVSPQAIRARIARRRAARADLTKLVVRDELAKTLVSDLTRLERIRRQVSKRARALRHNDDMTREWIALKRLEADVLDKKLHYSGADIPDAPADELAAAAERVRGRLDRLAAEAGAGPPSPRDRPDTT